MPRVRRTDRPGMYKISCNSGGASRNPVVAEKMGVLKREVVGFRNRGRAASICVQIVRKRLAYAESSSPRASLGF